ncbi:phosphoenolpyruvate carboxykinase (GTP) [archaeon]
MDKESFDKLKALNNLRVNRVVARYIRLLKPKRVVISDGSPEDIERIRRKAIKNEEELQLASKKHTVHYDGPQDPARAVQQTAIVVEKGMKIPFIRTREEEDALGEAHDRLDGIMKGKTMYVQFHLLGPVGCKHAMPCMQITDSAYVLHNENKLYNSGYEAFRGRSKPFNKLVHSAGRLVRLVDKISKDISKRGIYIDLARNTVVSVNTQYGGNSIGLKKLAMRLGISKADREGDWLIEHMFLMALPGKNGRKTYFAGAFPSACGKTSTAMVESGKIIGDDIAILWPGKDGKLHGANTEIGVFGIIEGVNKKDDPIMWKAIHDKNNEVIFSNVLMTEGGKPYWHKSGKPVPRKGTNLYGEWNSTKKDRDGKLIPASHKNARVTVGLEDLDNVDLEGLRNPGGVPLDVILYGGRDYEAAVPVQESFGWEHGMMAYGAALESQATTATLGQTGIKFDPMSMIDFLPIPLGRYLKNNLRIGRITKNPPKIFGVNYFLQDPKAAEDAPEDKKWLNSKNDKLVWLRWAEARVHGEAGAIVAPTGRIPKYEDLKRLFKKELGVDYKKADYEKQFTIRVNETLTKIRRVRKKYREEVKDTPKTLFTVLGEQEERLVKARKKYKADYITPKMLVANKIKA